MRSRWRWRRCSSSGWRFRRSCRHSPSTISCCPRWRSPATSASASRSAGASRTPSAPRRLRGTDATHRRAEARSSPGAERPPTRLSPGSSSTGPTTPWRRSSSTSMISTGSSVNGRSSRPPATRSISRSTAACLTSCASRVFRHRPPSCSWSAILTGARRDRQRSGSMSRHCGRSCARRKHVPESSDSSAMKWCATHSPVSRSISRTSPRISAARRCNSRRPSASPSTRSSASSRPRCRPIPRLASCNESPP